MPQTIDPATRTVKSAYKLLDARTYKKVKLQQNPSSTYEMEARFTTERRMLFAGDRLYIGGEHVTAPSTVFKKKQPLAAAFGAK